MTDRAWRQMHDWPIAGARRPGWMDEPEVLREQAAEEHDRICTEWEYAQRELPRPDTERREAA